MEPVDLHELEKQLTRPMDTEVSCGVWNVHKRLRYMFGDGDGGGITLAPSKLGGLKVTLRWRRCEQDVTALNRG